MQVEDRKREKKCKKKDWRNFLRKVKKESWVIHFIPLCLTLAKAAKLFQKLRKMPRAFMKHVYIPVMYPYDAQMGVWIINNLVSMDNSIDSLTNILLCVISSSFRQLYVFIAIFPFLHHYHFSGVYSEVLHKSYALFQSFNLFLHTSVFRHRDMQKKHKRILK